MCGDAGTLSLAGGTRAGTWLWLPRTGDCSGGQHPLLPGSDFNGVSSESSQFWHAGIGGIALGFPHNEKGEVSS